MATRTKEVGIRLSVKDEEVVKRALKSIGSEGEAALKRIERGAGPASLQLAALNRTAMVSRATLGSFATVAIGGVLPLFTLAGAINGARSAMEKFSAINDQSTAAGLDPEFFQGLGYAMKLVGVETQESASAFATYYKNVELAGQGQGKLYEYLQKSNPELIKSIILAKSQEDRVRLIADAIASSRDAAGLASKAFGDAGTRMVAGFEGGAKAIDAMISRAKDLGLIIDRQTIRNADELGDKFDTVTWILDNKFKTALINLAPLLVNMAQLAADLAGALGTFVDNFNAIENRSSQTLKSDLDTLNTLISKATDGNHPLTEFYVKGADGEGLKRMIARRDALQAEIDKRGNQIIVHGGHGGDKPTLPTTPAEDAQAKRIKDVEEALRQQLAALTMTDREQAIANELAKAHVTATSKDGQQIATLTGELYDQKKAIEANNEAASFFAQTFESGIEGLIDGSKSFTDVLGDMATALEKAVLQAALLGQGPLAGLFGTSSATSGSPGGIFGSLLGSLFSGGGGGLGISTPGITGGGSLLGNAKGNVFSAPGLRFYQNRIVDSPTFFPFAKGAGLMGEAGPEAIIPLQRDSRGRLGVSGGGGVQFNVSVINNGDATVTTRQRENGTGGLDVEFLVDSVVARKISTPGSATDRALRTIRGSQRQITKR